MTSRMIALTLLALPLFLGACGGSSSSSETSGAEGTTSETAETKMSCISEKENVNYTDEYCAPDGERGRTMYVYTSEMLDGYSGVTGRLVMTVTGMGGVPQSEGQYFIWIQGKDGGDTHAISALYHDQPETTRLRHTPWINNNSKYKEFNSRVTYDYLVEKVYTFIMSWSRTTVTLEVYESGARVMYQELPLSRPYSHVYEVRVGAHARNIANLGTSFNIREMRLTFFE